MGFYCTLNFSLPHFFFFQAHIAQISLGIAFCSALPNGVVQVCAGLLRLANLLPKPVLVIWVFIVLVVGENIWGSN